MDTTEPQETAIKNIIFDLGGIIVGLHNNPCETLFRGMKAFKTAAYVAEHRTEDFFLDLELGRITPHEFCDRVRELDGINIIDDAIILAWSMLLWTFPILPLLRVADLRKKYRVFLLSNTNEIHWERCKEMYKKFQFTDIESCFERCFLSYKMGMVKPSEEIFNAVLREANIKAEETLFIDDSYQNCKAAQKLGFNTICDPSGNQWMTIVENKLGFEWSPF